MLVQNNGGSQGLGLSWKWLTKEPERELLPLENIEVRLIDFLNNRITVTRDDGALVHLDELTPSNYFVIHVSVFNLRQETRYSYLAIKRSQFLSSVSQITQQEEQDDISGGNSFKSAGHAASKEDRKDESSKSKIRRLSLHRPVLVLSNVKADERQSRGMVAEIMDGTYVAFSIRLGSIDEWDSYMSKLETDFFLKSIHVLKATDARNNVPVYEIVLEVWHDKGMMKFLILDERYVHGDGWTIMQILKKEFEILQASITSMSSS